MVAAFVIVGLAGLYTMLGVVFAAAFLVFGIVRVDANAQHTGIGFRLILLPGVVALWPLLLRQWTSRGSES